MERSRDAERLAREQAEKDLVADHTRRLIQECRRQYLACRLASAALDAWERLFGRVRIGVTLALIVVVSVTLAGAIALVYPDPPPFRLPSTPSAEPAAATDPPQTPEQVAALKQDREAESAALKTAHAELTRQRKILRWVLNAAIVGGAIWGAFRGFEGATMLGARGRAAVEFASLADRFRQAANVKSRGPVNDFTAAFEVLMTRLDSARGASPSAPEWAVQKAKPGLRDWERDFDPSPNEAAPLGKTSSTTGVDYPENALPPVSMAR